MNQSELLKDYEIILDLLQKEREALQKNDAGRLAGLAPLIAQSVSRIGAYTETIKQLPEAERSVFNPILHQVLKESRLNEERWRNHRTALLQAREELQSARRFLRAAGPGRLSRPQLLDRTV